MNSVNSRIKEKDNENEINFVFNDLIYLLNFKEKTASLIGYESSQENICIPRSIQYKTYEFVITTIKTNSLSRIRARSIQIPSNSEIHTIEHSAFKHSPIESIFIPASITNLEEGCFSQANELNDIKISSNNQRYKNFDLKLVIGKSDINSDEYDVLVFAPRNIKTITIPPFIKKIAPYSFDHTSIEKISIPPHITEIGNNAFEFSKIKRIEISEDSELVKIGKFAFSYTSIEEIFIPSKLTELGEGWCKENKDLKSIEIMPNNEHFSYFDNKLIIGKSDINKEEYDTIYFARRDIKSVTIPSTIKIIESYSFEYSAIESIVIPFHVTEICDFAFNSCNNLQKIEISENSELQKIGTDAFHNSQIKRIFIPKHVKKIDKATFSYCESLQFIVFPLNSELETIENDAFCFTAIEKLAIPSNVLDLKDFWIDKTRQLNQILVSPNNKRYRNLDDKFIVGKSDISVNNYDILVFVRRDLKIVEIPPSIKIIASNAFSHSIIESITIPSQIIKLTGGAFNECFKLKKMVIPVDSKLQEIGSFAISSCLISSVYVPPLVTKYCNDSFFNCIKLRIIEIGDFVDIHSNIFEIVSFCKGAIILAPSGLRDRLIKRENSNDSK